MLGDGTLLALGGHQGATMPWSCGEVPGWNIVEKVDRVNPVAGTVAPFDPLPDKTWGLGVTMQNGSVAVAASICGPSKVPAFYFLKGVPEG
jgi:hypothetical protein